MTTQKIQWNNLTKQEIFDECVWHLLTQQTVSEDRYGLPRYQNRIGLSCPVGYLLEDSYNEVIENRPLDEVIDWLRKSGWDKKADVIQRHWKLLRQLQHIHDSVPPRFWVNALKRVARRARCRPQAILALEGKFKPGAAPDVISKLQEG